MGRSRQYITRAPASQSASAHLKSESKTSISSRDEPYTIAQGKLLKYLWFRCDWGVCGCLKRHWRLLVPVGETDWAVGADLSSTFTIVGETGMNIFSYTHPSYAVQIRADVEMPYLIARVTHRSQVIIIVREYYSRSMVQHLLPSVGWLRYNRCLWRKLHLYQSESESESVRLPTFLTIPRRFLVSPISATRQTSP